LKKFIPFFTGFLMVIGYLVYQKQAKLIPQIIESAPQLARELHQQLGKKESAKSVDQVHKSLELEREKLTSLHSDFQQSRDLLKRIEAALKVLPVVKENRQVRDQLVKKYMQEKVRFEELQTSMLESVKTLEALEVERKAAEKAASAKIGEPLPLSGL
jgi:hypothetical protein